MPKCTECDGTFEKEHYCENVRAEMKRRREEADVKIKEIASRMSSKKPSNKKPKNPALMAKVCYGTLFNVSAILLPNV